MSIQEQIEDTNLTPDDLENNDAGQVGEGEVHEEGEQVNEDEEQARAMGWVPKEEFKGDPERHISAEKFLRRGMEKLPILQKNYQELQNKYSETEKTLREMKEYQSHLSQKQYERALRDIQEQQRRAVEDGDTAAFDTLEREKSEVQKEFSPKQSQPNQYEQIERQEQLLNWNKKNEWYQKDRTLQMEADIIFKKLELTTPNLPLTEKLAYVEEKVKENNASKFTPQRRQQTPPTVQAGGNRKVVSGGKTWADIPKADQSSGEQWIKRGIVTREEYVKDYFGEK